MTCFSVSTLRCGAMTIALAALLICPPQSVRPFAARAGLPHSFQPTPAALDAIRDGACPCFAHGTPQSYVDQVSLPTMRHNVPDGAAGYVFSTHWSHTATNANVGAFQPCTLTYSIVPDYDTGDPNTSNTINATLDAQFGSHAVWTQLIRDSFNRWTEVSGVTCVEVTDDGAPWHNSPGALNQRGDVRLVAFPVDGPDGILAYTYFPNDGDMVLDIFENWADATQNYIDFRGTVEHELGHAIGLDHVIPLNETKLMEPFASRNYDGPQDDDIRGANRGYGDTFEPNDAPGSATDAGAFMNGHDITGLSLHTQSDVDWLRVGVSAGQSVRFAAVPVGASYSVGPDGGTAVPVNTLRIQGMTISVYDSTGNVLLGQSSAGAGGTATSPTVIVPGGSATVLVKITGNTNTNDVQRYTVHEMTGGAGVPRTLTVQSDGASNPTFTVSPPDNLGHATIVGGGALQFESGTSVTVTAPETVGTRHFARWIIDNANQPAGQTSLTITMSAAHTIKAHFGPALGVSAGPDQEIVAGTSAQLHATVSGGRAPYSFTWSPATELSDVHAAAPSASPNATTAYTVHVVDVDGLPGSDSVTVSVVRPLSVQLGDDIWVPADRQTQINPVVTGGSPPYTYEWSGSADFSAPNGSNPKVRLSETARITLMVRDSRDRAAHDSFTIRVAPPLEVEIGGPDGFNLGETLTLKAKITGGAAPYTFDWFPAPPGKEHDEQIETAPVRSTRYTLTITDAANQAKTVSRLITVIRELSVRIESSRGTVSAGDSLRLGAAVEGGLAPYKFSWRRGHNVLGKTASLELTVNESATFAVDVTDASGQSASSEISVSVTTPPSAALTTPTITGGNLCGSGVAGMLPLMFAFCVVYRNRQHRRP